MEAIIFPHINGFKEQKNEKTIAAKKQVRQYEQARPTLASFHLLLIESFVKAVVRGKHVGQQYRKARLKCPTKHRKSRKLPLLYSIDHRSEVKVNDAVPILTRVVEKGSELSVAARQNALPCSL